MSSSMDAARFGRWIVALGLVINTTAQAFLFTVLPTLGRGLGLSELQTGAVLGLGALLGMCAAPFWGFASERFGRRPVLLLTMAGVALSPLALSIVIGGIAALVPAMLTFLLLLGARSIQAVFGAGLIPTAQAYFADVTSRADRAAGMGIMSASLSVGSVTGSALVWAVAGFDTVYGFVILAALAGLTVLLAALRLPEPPRAPALEVDAHKIPFARVWPYFAVTALAMSAYSMMQPITGLRMMDQFGLPQAAAIGQAGLVLMATALAMIFSQSVLAVRLKWPPQRMLIIGGLSGFAGLAILTFAGDFLIVAGAMMVIGASIGLLLPGNLAAMSLATGAKAQGKVAGINAVALGVGLVVGPMSGAALYHIAPIVPSLVATGLLAALIAIVLFATRPRGERPAEAIIPALAE